MEIQFLRFFETEIDVDKEEDVTLDKYSGLFLGTSSDSTVILGKILLPKETELKSSLISLARIDNSDNPIWKSFNSDKNGYFTIKNLS